MAGLGRKAGWEGGGMGEVRAVEKELWLPLAVRANFLSFNPKLSVLKL